MGTQHSPLLHLLQFCDFVIDTVCDSHSELLWQSEGFSLGLSELFIYFTKFIPRLSPLIRTTKVANKLKILYLIVNCGPICRFLNLWLESICTERRGFIYKLVPPLRFTEKSDNWGEM